MLTAEEARQIWRYDPQTGELFWLINTRNGKGSVGMSAGYITNKGYYVIAYNKNIYLRSRLAWLITTGTWPYPFIDHIDQNPQNDAISNLRLATRSQNAINTGKREQRKNQIPSSVFKGVYRRKNKWAAQITANKKYRYLGSFDTEELAYSAYCEAAKQLHGAFARLA